MQLNTSKQINAIRKNIKKWDEIRNTELGLNFLTSGYGFEVLRSDYEELAKKHIKDSNYYVYLGVYEFELLFYVLPKHIDKMESEDPIITCMFTRETDDKPCNSLSLSETEYSCFSGTGGAELTENEALKRTLNWFVHSHRWFVDNKTVQFFTVPSADLRKIFSSKQVTKALFFLAITSDKIYGDYIELIVCDETTSNNNTVNNTVSAKRRVFMDLTRPCPPFS